ncbi:MAG TPA: hypothetical protein VLH84_05805 [Patescibacteria group bacterium]|nr:hypothetical protein [Patescibacteria group bacterium]
MRTLQFYSRPFAGTVVQETAIGVWRPHYEKLVAQLGALGTEVSRDKTIESDPTIPPGTFLRRVVHAFVFPPQPVEDEADTSRLQITNPAPGLTHESLSRPYDPELVQGHVAVTYDDSNGRIEFSIRDMHEGGSTLHEAVHDRLDALEAAGAQAV